jgi:hypothetical protein
LTPGSAKRDRAASEASTRGRIEHGYSGTPLAKKLGIKEGSSLVLLGAPEGFDDVLDETMPTDVSVRTRASGTADVVMSFHTKRADLTRRLPVLAKVMDVDGAIWIAWPKKASGVPTDITEDTIREVALPTGLVDVKVCAVDETWSGLRLCWRKDLRAAKRAGG